MLEVGVLDFLLQFSNIHKEKKVFNFSELEQIRNEIQKKLDMELYIDISRQAFRNSNNCKYAKLFITNNKVTYELNSKRSSLNDHFISEYISWKLPQSINRKLKKAILECNL
jgi:6-pyruvoyl-tetrahydropterin synthase